MNDKDVLHSYLGVARESLAWKLEGLTEFEARLPRTPTGTSLLGLLKHGVVSARVGKSTSNPKNKTARCWCERAEVRMLLARYRIRP